MDDNLNTKTKLLNKVKELEANKREVELGYKNDELYSQYQTQLNELNQKREKLRLEMSCLRSEHERDCRDEVVFIKEEIQYMKNLADESDGLNPKDFGPDIQEAFKACGSGTTTPHHMFRLVWVSQDEQYAVFKMRGHGGGAYPNSWYLNVRYNLHHIPTVVEGGFYKIKHNYGTVMWWEGKRWSKARLKEVVEAAIKHSNETLS